MNNTSGRISTKNRQALVLPVKEFAQDSNIPVNLVMSAVLWTGERLQGRITLKALKDLLVPETVLAYAVNRDARMTAHQVQITGLVRNLLPKSICTEETIKSLSNQAPSGASIPTIRDWVKDTVYRMGFAPVG